MPVSRLPRFPLRIEGVSASRPMYYTPGMTSEEIETESPKRPRWTDYLSLDEVEPALANAKRHDLEAIAASYDRFGYVEPITMDERTGRLVAGHGRIASLLGRRIRGESAPEGIVVGGDGWLVPVGRGWESANDYEARAYLIASNKLSEAGGWDLEELATEASQLRDGPGLLGTGLEETELDDLLSLLDPPLSLEELSAMHGEPEASDFWPVLRFRVSPELKDRFLKLTGHLKGGDHDSFLFLLDRAEAAAEP